LSTENERINEALNGNYTPLINAIISGNITEVRRVLPREDANQRDNTYNWCPTKWVYFIRFYGNRYSDEDFEELLRILHENGGTACFDENHIREDSYNYSPVILDIDEAIEKMRKEFEEDHDDDHDNYYDNNRINTSGGTRKISSRKSKKTKKYRKGKKSHKKANKTTTKKRKHTKK